MFELKDKVCLITGAGGGLGHAIAKTLGRDGAIIIGCDVNADALKKSGEALADAGIRSHAVQAGIHNEADVEKCIRETMDAFGGVDILINNAAVDVTLPIDEISVEDWDKVLGVNLRGPFLMSKAVFSHMRHKRQGQIVNIVSTAAKRAWANAIAYHSSKWGLLGFSHALHVEGRQFNIKVTAVISGGMRTPFLLDRFPDIDVSTLQDPLNVARTVKFVLEQPEETVIPEIMVLPMKETSWP